MEGIFSDKLCSSWHTYFVKGGRIPLSSLNKLSEVATINNYSR